MNPLTLGQQMAQFGNQASAPNVGTNLLAQALQGYQSQTGPGPQPGGLGGGLGGALPNRGPAITPPAPSFPVTGTAGAGVGFTPPVPEAPAPVAPAPVDPHAKWKFLNPIKYQELTGNPIDIRGRQ